MLNLVLKVQYADKEHNSVTWKEIVIGHFTTIGKNPLHKLACHICLLMNFNLAYVGIPDRCFLATAMHAVVLYNLVLTKLVVRLPFAVVLGLP